MYEGFITNAGNLLAGMSGYIDPNLLTAFAAQNAATGGNGAINNTGSSAAKVVNAKNAMDGVDLDAILKQGLERTGSEDTLAKQEKQISDILSAQQWGKAGASVAPNVMSGLKTALDKSYTYAPLWSSATVRLPTYVLGR